VYTFSHVEPLDHRMRFVPSSLPVYVASSGNVTEIVDASITVPVAVGRLAADMSTTTAPFAVEMTGLVAP
jgi:hypothetical protein